jgi:hypothetical protein
MLIALAEDPLNRHLILTLLLAGAKHQGERIVMLIFGVLHLAARIGDIAHQLFGFSYSNFYGGKQWMQIP